MPLERKSTRGYLPAAPVTEPLQTGIKAIDAMIPIGRGQRGVNYRRPSDREKQPSLLTLSSINQKEFYEKENRCFVFIFVADKKHQQLQIFAQTLEENGAMAYTVIVAANAF